METEIIQANIQIKLEQAYEAAQKGSELCLTYIRDTNPKHLKHMGGYLGTCVNNLRSALNYATIDYCEQRGLKYKDGKEISTDFPYSFTKTNFRKILLVKLISQSDHELYKFIEGIQPYNADNWLGLLMRLSNIDKHKLLIDVQRVDAKILMMMDKHGLFPLPIIANSEVVIISPDRKSVLSRPTPCYVETVKLFAMPNGQWLNFYINMDNKIIGFYPFIKTITAKTQKAIQTFYEKFS